MNMVDVSEGIKQLHSLIISKETVKPSSPTPSHLKTYNLSLLDQFGPPIYIPFVFFYPNCGGSRRSSHDQEKSAQLKKSLSETLAQYYPFSGRIADGYHVDCNDEGVEFVEAQINAPLSQLLHRLRLLYEPLDQLFPTDGVWGNANKASSALVRVQLSYFACGGLALAVSMSHRIVDACTLCAFLNHWAALTRRNSGEESKQVLPQPPHFKSSPESKADFDLEYLLKIDKGINLVTKKFVFPNPKLEQLKAKVKHQTAEREEEIAAMNPTRIEVLTSLLYGCAVRAAKASSSDYSAKIFVLAQSMNLRNRMMKPLPETAAGNIVSFFTIPTMSESELGLDSLTTRIKKAKMQLTGKTDSQVNQWVTQMAEASKKSRSSTRVASFGCTSMCKFPLYKVDFGWGKPIRVSVPEPLAKNLFLLMDTPGEDGIEVLLTLEEQIMATFQNDEQLLAFAM